MRCVVAPHASGPLTCIIIMLFCFQRNKACMLWLSGFIMRQRVKAFGNFSVIAVHSPVITLKAFFNPQFDPQSCRVAPAASRAELFDQHADEPNQQAGSSLRHSPAGDHPHNRSINAAHVVVGQETTTSPRQSNRNASASAGEDRKASNTVSGSGNDAATIGEKGKSDGAAALDCHHGSRSQGAQSCELRLPPSEEVAQKVQELLRLNEADGSAIAATSVAFGLPDLDMLVLHLKASDLCSSETGVYHATPWTVRQFHTCTVKSDKSGHFYLKVFVSQIRARAK
jgi:hypothetical protein